MYIEDTKRGEMMGMIGSSNYGARSYYRDMESNMLMQTRNTRLIDLVRQVKCDV